MPIDIDLSNWNKENGHARPNRPIRKCLMVQENARNSDGNGGRTYKESSSGKALMVNRKYNQHDSDSLKTLEIYDDNDEASRPDQNESELFEVYVRRPKFSRITKYSNATIEGEHSFFADDELSKQLGAFRFSGSGGQFSSTSLSSAAQPHCQFGKARAISGAAIQQQQERQCRHFRVLSQC